MNPHLIEAMARSSKQDATAEARAARRIARLRDRPKLAAEVLRSIITAEDAARAATRRSRETRLRRAPAISEISQLTEPEKRG